MAVTDYHFSTIIGEGKMNSYYDSFLKMGLNKNYQNAKNEIDKLTSSDRYKEYIQAAKEASEAEKNPSQKAEKENEEEAEGESDTIDLSAEGLYFSNFYALFYHLL